jgi:hypothetical protein
MYKMMNKLIHTFLFAAIVLAVSPAYSQLVEIGLQENPALIKHIRENPAIFHKSSLSNDTLELPFFDDFSSYSIFPADTTWADRDVFVNTGYAVAPPSIGVATLDALDYTGALHQTATSSQFESDHLTSLPIDLSGISVEDSLFLSFFYQPQGRGDDPEESDSLVLEYYSPEQNEWYWAWSATGSTIKSFKSVILPIANDTLYYHKGFQFRFKNYASLTGLFEASWASNADQWHIDYVYLDTGRTYTDTALVDLTFIYGPTYFLKDFTAMPWTHFLINSDQMVDTFSFRFSNYRTNPISIIREIEIYDLITNDPPYEVIGGGGASNNFPPGDTTIQHNPNYTFSTATSDKAEFLIQAWVKPGEVAADFSQSNDTAGYVQIFDNYYAHDDGSPEGGVGLSGQGSQNGMLAVKYYNYKTDDSLRAVDMYFNRTIGDASQKYFFLRIWAHDSNTGLPGDLLYDQMGERPEYEDSLYKFHRYFLKGSLGQDTAINVPDTFYVGWKQTTTDLLNIGFDKNMVRPPEGAGANWRNPWIVFNTTGGWQSSAKTGAIMIRPVFSEEVLVGIEEPVEKPSDLTIYPNPTTGIFTIDLGSDNGSRNSRIDVYSATGQLVLSQHLTETRSRFDLQSHPAGIYFLRINSDGQIVKQGKLLIVR